MICNVCVCVCIHMHTHACLYICAGVCVLLLLHLDCLQPMSACKSPVKEYLRSKA